MKQKHKGFTLIELLMAIFISSLTLGLIAQILTLMVVSSKDTILNGQANISGMLMVDTIENRIRTFNPTSLILCEGQENCVILEQHYQYIIDENGIQVEYFETPKTLQIEFTDGQIILTREIGTPFLLDLKGFTLSPLSEIKLIGTTGIPVDGEKATVIFEIVLIADDFSDKTFSFTGSYSFTIDLVELP